MDSIKTASIASGSVLVTGIGANWLVPLAMSTCGTVVPGVGTMHAAGGVAATLQTTAGLCTVSHAIIVGACSVPLFYLRSTL